MRKDGKLWFIKYQRIEFKKKYHQLHKQHLHSDSAFKTSEETDQQDCVWAREVNTPSGFVTTILFQEVKLDSVSYSSPSHL